MKTTLINIALTGLMLASNAWAVNMPESAKKNGCTSCHAIDKKLMGPAWMDVANKYKGDAKAASYLDQKIAKGGSGVWGTMPMPANVKVSDADRKALVSFILGLAK